MPGKIFAPIRKARSAAPRRVRPVKIAIIESADRPIAIN